MAMQASVLLARVSSTQHEWYLPAVDPSSWRTIFFLSASWRSLRYKRIISKEDITKHIVTIEITSYSLSLLDEIPYQQNICSDNKIFLSKLSTWYKYKKATPHRFRKGINHHTTGEWMEHHDGTPCGSETDEIEFCFYEREFDDDLEELIILQKDLREPEIEEETLHGVRIVSSLGELCDRAGSNPSESFFYTLNGFLRKDLASISLHLQHICELLVNNDLVSVLSKPTLDCDQQLLSLRVALFARLLSYQRRHLVELAFAPEDLKRAGMLLSQWAHHPQIETFTVAFNDAMLWLAFELVSHSPTIWNPEVLLQRKSIFVCQATETHIYPVRTLFSIFLAYTMKTKQNLNDTQIVDCNHHLFDLMMRLNEKVPQKKSLAETLFCHFLAMVYCFITRSFKLRNQVSYVLILISSSDNLTICC